VPSPSAHDQARLDAYLASRSRKAKKIEVVLEEHLGPDLSTFRALDVGCSPGWIVQSLQHRFRELIGVDVQRDSLAQTLASAAGKLPRLVAGDAAHLPFSSERFDVVIYAQVYEHVPDQQAVVDEIWRVLRPGGVCFFSGPNRLAFMEDHYRLPLLSWLPRPAAIAYMKLFRRNKVYDIHPRTLWTIRNQLRRFRITDYTARMLRHPSRYSVDEHVRESRAFRTLPNAVLHALRPLYPNFNWMIEKPAQAAAESPRSAQGRGG
jgi:2-polyprenyl-3-methyl-5-hydroxy-6-metoxy-1,4-benzoquinol methylase